jgi:hypothetical protein
MQQDPIKLSSLQVVENRFECQWFQRAYNRDSQAVFPLSATPKNARFGSKWREVSSELKASERDEIGLLA